MNDAWLARLESLMMRLESALPGPVLVPDFAQAAAFRWERRGGRAWLRPVRHPRPIRLDDLLGVDEQKAVLVQNTRQFLAGRPANNVLLTGARGTGKSSLVRAVLLAFAERGLKVVEMDKALLSDLPDLVDLVAGRRERFVLFCDDLSFAEDEPGYPALKALLDGSMMTAGENLLVYATSNRRHLMPEYMVDNERTRHRGGEIHPDEAVEERVSLSERFGIWLSFYPFDQAQYLAIARHWVLVLGGRIADAARFERAALQWAQGRGSRNGRVAWQFARDWVGRRAK